jgi:hypothetical protein
MKASGSRRIGLFLVFTLLVHTPAGAVGPALDWLRVAEGRRGFALASSGSRFVPWGFNYDHDENGRLLEDYWEAEWPKVVADFREMKDLGANVVRVHLQLARFMNGPAVANARSLDRLAKLVALAEETGLYLDLTGLGCYRRRDVPPWYDALDEPGRWAVQARFWEAVASRCAASPAVFCYDLMNEPVVTGGSRKLGEWLAGEFGGFSYVQFITLEQKGRPRPEIARAWVETLARSIRRVDRRHLITVGMVDWSLDRPGLSSGFVPATIAPAVDFLCVHLYPKAGKVDEAITTLEGFAAAGKPVLIEETFPLSCGVDEFRTFLARTKKHAAGWVGFYWGKTPEELKGSKTISDALTRGWLEIFRAGPP